MNGEFAIEFQNSDRFNVGYGDIYEFLPQPFPIASGVTVPVGGYDFASVRTGFNLGQQRRVSGNFLAEYGTFYSGHKTAISLSRGRTNLTPQLSFEPSVSVNWVDLAEGSFTTHLVGSRVTYTMTPLMFVSALAAVQLGQQCGDRQRAPALGVPAGQRAVRGVQRTAGHAGPALSRAREPRGDRQDQSHVPVLKSCPDPP